MLRTRFRLGLAAMAAIILAACGGGDSSATGGAGAGTGGATAERAVVTSGVITGFGSVYVNGIHFETNGAEISKDGERVTQQGLRVGQVVHVRGRIDDRSGRATADSVRQDDDLEGPITSIDAANQTFVVLAHTVRVTTETSFDDSLGTFADLAVGLQVEISGLKNAAGEVVATRIEKRKAGETRLEVMGKVSLLDTTARTFRIGPLTVDYTGASLRDFPASGLANDQNVEVKGTALNSAGALVATSVELRDFERGSGSFQREVEGLITRYVSATDFDVAGRKVTTTSTTRYEHGTAADLALNVKVEAEGTIDAAGVLVAVKVEFKRGNNAGLAGIVDNVTADSSGLGGTLTVLGVTVTVDNNTRIEDKSDADIEMFRLSNVQVGDYVEIRGTETAPLRLTASRLEREDRETRSWVRGTVRDLVAPNMTVLGVPVSTSASTRFEEVSATDFFANAAGRVVKAKGIETANQIAATEIEFEDHDD
ncbi:MAG: hypothetical protein IPM70_00315 [Proteobacteria bacterium]|nr:hypothetical protein [Pseudomonadota bacterium]